MDERTRRDVLRHLGAGAAAGTAASWLAGGLLDRALAIAPAGGTGTIRDVAHVVVLMQENRSFDHYFGRLNGVRGFGDPRPLRLATGHSVWAQPSDQHPDGHVLPYHGDSRLTRSFTVDGGDQSHGENMHILHGGRFDRWGRTRELQHRMLHYDAGDLPFYYALADAFTVCDAYHCSTMTQTYPNRLHLFTGCNGGGTVGGDPEMRNYGEDETPSADMATDRPLDPGAYRWTTYAERLQAAGVDWKVYQEYDNFGDNLLSLFPPFRPCARDSALYRRGRSWVSEHRAGADRIRSDGTQLVAAFRDDIAGGRLPQVSWIVPAAELSEHPTHAPAKGEHFVAQLIAALVDHPAVFARTVLILNYDEPGGFFDHMPPPIPPVGGYRGRSTVPLDGEAKAYRGTGLADDAVHPLGLGYRTPTVIVSPWTRGGHVCSQLFDHTSVLRFLEARFGVVEPNISAWRRAVCGDLTACFDFTGAAAAPLRPLPDTADVRARVARSAAGSGFAIPAVQAPTAQMPGQRGHRPLPYRFAVDCRPDAAGRPVLAMVNTGPVGIVLAVHDQYHREAPHHFTIGAGDRIDADWPVGEAGFDCIVHGPNGCWRRFAGRAGAAATVVRLVDHPAIEAVAVHIDHAGPHPADVTVTFGDDYPAAGDRVRRLTVAPGRPVRDLWRLAASDGWYDLTVTCTADAQALWRYAGKVETGRQGRTDPAIGTIRL